MIRNRIKAVRFDLVQLGYRVEWCWVVEPFASGLENHVHAYQWGDYIPQPVLSDVAAARGMGFRAFIQELRTDRGGGYGLKAVGSAESSYALKQVEAERFLELNGGRLTHQSAEFFRALGTAEGVRLGVRAVEREAMTLLRRQQAGWVCPNPARHVCGAWTQV